MSEREAGRALDAEVAEKVLGWRWRTWDPEAYTAAPMPRYASPEECVMVPPGVANERLMPVATTQRKRFGANPPAFSTDIAAAWEVVEKLARGGGWQLKLHGPIGGTRATFVWWGDALPTVPSEKLAAEADADTAPLAICLAAIQVAERGVG